MALKIVSDSNQAEELCQLAIDEDMTIYTINMLKQGISEVLDRYKRFELNLADVEEMDSAGIQLLLALKNELQQKKKEFKLVAISASVAKLFQSYDLNERFNIGGAA